MFRIILPLVDYSLNYTYIASELCEQKDIPDNSCLGTCHLSKKIGNQIDKESGSHKIVMIEFIKIPHQPVNEYKTNCQQYFSYKHLAVLFYRIINHSVKPQVPPPKIIC